MVEDSAPPLNRRTPPRPGRLRTSRVILATGSLLALLLTLGAALGLWRLRIEELDEARADLSRLALVLSDQTEHAFQIVDLVVRHARGEVTEHFADDRPRDPAAIHDLLGRKIFGPPHGQALMLFDAEGRMVAHSRVFPTPEVTVADRDYFIAQKTAPDDRPFVSTAHPNRVDGRWMISLSRRVPGAGPDGFGGVVMASIEIAYFHHLYQELELPEGVSILVQRADGSVLIGHPGDEETAPELSPLGPLDPKAAPSPPRRMIGGEPTLVASRGVPGLPLVVVALQPERAALRSWDRLALPLGLGASVSVAAILALTLLLAAKVRHLELREIELQAARDHAEGALADLGTARRSLIQSERMASLGALVAGVAHEINTPLGSTVMSASLLAEESRRMIGLLDTTMRKSDLSRFLELTSECSDLMLTNAQRAADLMKSFKQVAVDQTSDGRRVFDLREYLDEVLTSLRPRLKRSGVRATLECPEELSVDGRPGPLAQILTNFVMNSLTHAFEPDQPGRVTITASLSDDDRVRLVYTDNGKGIPEAVRPKIFDPFFTTNRDGGGSGLGLAIVDALVRQTLFGDIAISGPPEGGATFTLDFPRVLPPEAV